MTIGAESLEYSCREREANELVLKRRELCAEQRRLLTTLREARDRLNQIGTWVGDRDVGQLILAFEIVIAIAEGENFEEMRADRIPIVLYQIESRLWRLGKLLQGSKQRVSCHLAAQHCALAALRRVPSG